MEQMEQKTTKVCARCNRELDVTNFNKNRRNKDGLQTYCKDCQREMNELSYKRARTNATPTKERNPELAKFKPVQLIEKLRARGYKGSLTYTYEITL